MATLAVNDETTIDISEALAGKVETSQVTIESNGESIENVSEIKLGSEGSLNTETEGNSVLTGESLIGTEEAPSSISLVSEDTEETQVLVVSTKSVKNAVIVTKAPTSEDDKVAKADIDLSSEVVENVSVKTSSTEEKSVTLSSENVRTGLVSEAGGDLTVEATSFV